MTNDQKVLSKIASQLVGIPVIQLTTAEKNIFEVLYEAEILCSKGEEVAWYNKADEVNKAFDCKVLPFPD